MKNKIFLFLFSLLLVAPSFAASQTFWKGFVFIGGQPAANGSVLEAFVNNVTLVANYTIGSINSGRDGYYIIPVEVATIDGGHNVSFRVNGVYPYTGANGSDASLQPVNTFLNVLNISINLTSNGGACRPYTGVTNATSYNNSGCSGSFCVHDLCRAGSTFCGDGFCDSGETSATCSSDCGAAAAGGGGAAGGGAAAVSVTTNPVTISAGTTQSIAIDATKTKDVAVAEITIAAKETATNVAITVKESSKPADAPAPVSTAGAVYKYVDITAVNITTSSISTAKVKFKVPKSWITSNGIDANTVKLNRYVGNDWTKLATSKVSDDGTDITYESDTPGFSTFAITGEKVAAAAPTATPAPTVVPPVATPVKTLTTPTPTPTPIAAPAQTTLYIFIAVVLVVAAYMFIRWGKPKKKHLRYSYKAEKE